MEARRNAKEDDKIMKEKLREVEKIARKIRKQLDSEVHKLRISTRLAVNSHVTSTHTLYQPPAPPSLTTSPFESKNQSMKTVSFTFYMLKKSCFMLILLFVFENDAYNSLFVPYHQPPSLDYPPSPTYMAIFLALLLSSLYLSISTLSVSSA